eukprot:CAMPEP_0185830766 /NCGR_PEP_ID=MMETSP1353-20130828/1066_1 /TAXON_ID=1077150 /ORGANISM="Erythrolobus australicus, Strain CCMP3124" /LENGTH=254 /DNA_ID=CAMNT_0028528739 /DNA_START=606 /DNA_END=1372 /DNA_ORIENTATION=+
MRATRCATTATISVSVVDKVLPALSAEPLHGAHPPLLLATAKSRAHTYPRDTSRTKAASAADRMTFDATQNCLGTCTSRAQPPRARGLQAQAGRETEALFIERRFDARVLVAKFRKIRYDVKHGAYSPIVLDVSFVERDKTGVADPRGPKRRDARLVWRKPKLQRNVNGCEHSQRPAHAVPREVDRQTDAALLPFLETFGCFFDQACSNTHVTFEKAAVDETASIADAMRMSLRPNRLERNRVDVDVGLNVAKT